MAPKDEAAALVAGLQWPKELGYGGKDVKFGHQVRGPHTKDYSPM